ncbi:MAG: hypothetical protein AAGA90_05055 [Actinomycetota bacterium]
MNPRSIIAVLVTLILILTAALLVVTWGGDDDDAADTATDTTTTTLDTTTTTTVATTTTTVATTTTTIPVECGGEDDTATDTDDTTDSTTTTDSSTTTTTTEAPADAEDDDTATTTTVVPTIGPNDSVSTIGLGEVDFGMTIRQAEAAAGTRMIPCGPVGECYRVIPAEAPEGISFLVTASTIERVDIVAGPITTRSGVGIGSTQERIVELFGDQIETSINDDSSVDLIFVPQDELDAEFRVIFTIRDGVVETYRSGRVPQVTDADPCAGL